MQTLAPFSLWNKRYISAQRNHLNDKCHDHWQCISVPLNAQNVPGKSALPTPGKQEIRCFPFVDQFVANAIPDDLKPYRKIWFYNPTCCEFTVTNNAGTINIVTNEKISTFEYECEMDFLTIEGGDCLEKVQVRVQGHYYQEVNLTSEEIEAHEPVIDIQRPYVDERIDYRCCDNDSEQM